jgi:hypothetical protein
LESVPECNSVPLLIRRCVDVFVTEFREQITNECPNLIENNDIERKKYITESRFHITMTSFSKVYDLSLDFSIIPEI